MIILSKINSKFINKEYNIIKKEMKKHLENLNSELSSLETKKEQIQKNHSINSQNNKGIVL